MMKQERFVAEKGYDVQFGARPLKRAIQTHLEDGLSELIITSSLKEKDVIQVSLNKEKGELEMKVIASMKEDCLNKISYKICQNVRP